MIISRPCALPQTFVGRGPSRLLSLRRQFRLQPASPKAKYGAPGHKGPRSSGHTCFVLLGAKPSNVTSVSGMPIGRTHLKRDGGNTEDCLCNRVKLTGVNVLLILCGCGIADLCERSTIFNRLVHRFFHRPAHHWGVFL